MDDDLRGLGEPYTKAHEGCRLQAYQDTLGVWTVGWGQTGPDVGPGTVWTQDQADAGFDVRWGAAAQDAQGAVSAECWNAMGLARRAVLCDMAYQLGFRGLRSFNVMRSLLEAERWADAADDALASLAAKETPNRWADHADVLRAGDVAIVGGKLPTR